MTLKGRLILNCFLVLKEFFFHPVVNSKFLELIRADGQPPFLLPLSAARECSEDRLVGVCMAAAGCPAGDFVASLFYYSAFRKKRL